MNQSNKKPLRIKDLSVRKVPGFSSGMKPFKGFSDGINIIAGPNASGKSTTATAIQKLIWQSDTRNMHLIGQAEMDGEPWTLEVDSDKKVVQRHGVDDEITGVPAAEEQNRYMLALHKLLTADSKDLAQRIIRESVGGYDPGRAGEELGYDAGIKSTSKREYIKYSEAEKTVRESQESQKSIKKKEQRLGDLYREREEAELSARRRDFYDLAVEKMKSERKYTDLREQMQEFPDVLEKANGEELKRVEEIESEIAEAGEAIRAAKSKITECRERLDQLSIPDTGVAEHHLSELESRTVEIKDLEREIDRLEADRAELEKRRSEALRQIGKDVDPKAWQGLDLEDIGDLDHFLQEAHRVAGEKRILEKEIGDLEREEKPETADRDLLNRGITSLTQWLKEVPESQKFPSWVIIAIAVLAVVSAFAGYFAPLAGLVGMIVILFLSVYGLMQLKNSAGHSKSEIRVEDYRSTGLTPPEAWNPESVSERLDSLTEELREARWQERINQKIENSRSRLQDLDGSVKQIVEKGEDLKERLSALPDLPFDEPLSYTSLAVFIKHVQQWQKDHTEYLSVTEKLEKVKEQYREKMESFSERISDYTDEKVHDSAGAGALYKTLKNQEEQRVRNEEEIRREEKTISDRSDLIDRRQDSLKEIYEKFELQTGQKNQLRDLLNRLDDYRETASDTRLAKQDFEKAKRKMEEHSLYGQEADQADELTLDQAEEIRQKLGAEAEKVNQIWNEIAEIEAKVNTVKSGNSLEKALKNRDEAVLELKGLYEKNLSDITGQLLVATLKEEMREKNRPKVFKEANRLFNRITKGRYELRVTDKEESEFRAYDTVDQIGRSLDELSSGTRIQLLLAVRLAFVETQETSVKLPILADELLANSDDVRAEAIIEALTEISRDGRQVFYFTAQGDEVAKWESYLGRNGEVDYKVFRLYGEKSDEHSKDFKFDWKLSRLVHHVPEPASLDHKRYGERLNIPAFNPVTDEPEQLHLWYLIEDPNLLHSVLSAGISRWGALRSYLAVGGVIEGLDEPEIRKMEEKAELLDRFLKLYRQGRPKPIDRSVLEESGATRVDEVADLLAKQGNNPKKLIDTLNNGALKRYHGSVIDRMEEFFLEQGYLDTREPLNENEIFVRLQAMISNLELTREEADRFLKSVRG